MGKRIARSSSKEITVFKSVGTAIPDVSVSARAYQLTKEQGIGEVIELP